MWFAASTTSLAQVDGIKLYMQPVQNITVDDRVSRTQYQYTLEDPDVNELNQWTNSFVDKLKQLPQLEDVATDQQTGGLTVSLAIDRVSASRLGIAPSTSINTLYDAFGQRQINTMYTQLNQYHVILEAQPQFPKDPGKLNKMYIQSNASSGATGAAASTSFSASASATAGSNATTEGALYTPSSGVLTPPANALARQHQRDRLQLRQYHHQLYSQQRRPAGCLRPRYPGYGVALHQPPGSVPVRHGFLQPGAAMPPWVRPSPPSTRPPRI